MQQNVLYRTGIGTAASKHYPEKQREHINTNQIQIFTRFTEKETFHTIFTVFLRNIMYRSITASKNNCIPHQTHSSLVSDIN